MKHFILCLFCIAGSMALQAQQLPIADFGQMSVVPELDIRAEANLPYKVAVELKQGDTTSTSINFSLDVLARYVNMLAYDGVGAERRKVVAIMHNMGAYLLLNDAASMARFGHNNPNTILISRLQQAGVQFVLCGQSAVKRHLGKSDLLPGVKLATSYMTAFTTLQLQGYAAMSL